MEIRILGRRFSSWLPRPSTLKMSASSLKPLDAALLLRKSYVFDLPWYTKKHNLGGSGGRPVLRNAIEHFLARAPQLPDLTPGLWFDPKWYRGQHHVIQTGSAGALSHFLRVGEPTGADPGPYFHSAHYAGRYPILAKSKAEGKVHGALEYYVLHGEALRHSPNQWFDEVWYVERDARLLEAVAAGEIASGFRHFLAAGRDEMRDPGPTFSERRYRGANHDVAIAIADGTMRSGFEHWLLFGRAEGRPFGHAVVEGKQLVGAW